MRDNYWRLVAKRASKEARAVLSIETGGRAVVGVILTITAIALLWFFGSEGAPWDAALERIGPWIAVIIAIYPLVWIWKFIRTPPRLDAERIEQIEELEEQLAPLLQFVWTSDTIKEEHGTESPTNIEGKIGRVMVRNLSDSRPARSVEVALLSCFDVNRNEELRLDLSIYSESTQELRVNINPDRHAQFNVFKIKHKFAKIMLGPFASGRRNNLEPGTYRIEIIASAEAGKPIKDVCYLQFDSYYSIEFRKWELGDSQKHDRVIV